MLAERDYVWQCTGVWAGRVCLLCGNDNFDAN